MNLTKEQLAVATATLKKGDCLKAVAMAGTGKTSVLVAYAEQHPQERILYLVFNKTMADDAQRRFPANTECRTSHALALRAMRGKYPEIVPMIKHAAICARYSVDGYEATIIEKTMDSYMNSDHEEFTRTHLVADWLDELSPERHAALFAYAQDLWKQLRKGKGDFLPTHSVYLKEFQLSHPRLRYDTILLDEAQDTAPVVLDLVLRQCQHGVRLILSGDPYQQCYAWRAAVDSLEKVEAPTLYLTNSFRFGSNVAGVANTLLDTFWPGEGRLVGVAGEDQVTGAEDESKPCTVVCRTNAMLYTEAVHKLPAPLMVVGGRRFSELLEAVENLHWLQIGRCELLSERYRWFAKMGEIDGVIRYAQRRLKADLLSYCRIAKEHGPRIPEQVETLRRCLATPRTAKFVFSTVHQYKGLEADRVRVADDFADVCTLDGETAVLDANGGEGTVTREDLNLIYIAFTRAKRELILPPRLYAFVTGHPQMLADERYVLDDWRDEE